MTASCPVGPLLKHTDEEMASNFDVDDGAVAKEDEFETGGGEHSTVEVETSFWLHCA